MPSCKAVSTATHTVVKLSWSRALERRRGFSVGAKSAVDFVHSYIEGDGGHKRASFVASLNKDGTVQLKRKCWGIFNYRRTETVEQGENFSSGLLRFFRLTQT